MIEKLKLIAGKLKYPVTAEFTDGRIYFEFPYNATLMDEIKVMKGSKYHGFEPKPRKIWSVEDCPRNRFQLERLKGNKPYAWFERPLIEFEPNRKTLYKHQYKMAQIGLTYRYAIWAAEMRTGKTLAAIEVLEHLNRPDIFWVGPKSALASVQLEFIKWKTKVKPMFMTFEHLKKVVEGWTPGFPPPHVLIVDEASRCKNEMAQRSVAVQHMADAIRKEYLFDGCVIEMSGSPAPKSPVDWKSLCEIAWPGYLREGRLDKFKARLALITKAESVSGGMFPKLVTWWDDENKCQLCGKLESDFIHQSAECTFIKSKNEVSFLYQRMKGLVHVFMKKDCLDLPAKRFEIKFVPPTQAMLNAMETIVGSGVSAMEVMTRCRELSDGFQYQDIVSGTERCPECHGDKVTEQEFYIGPEATPDECAEFGVTSASQIPANIATKEFWKKEKAACPACKGRGEVNTYNRESIEFDCPKEQVIKDLLAEHEEHGRCVIGAGFTGSIDKLVALVDKLGWKFIRVDGRGWFSNLPHSSGEMITNDIALLKIYQRLIKDEILNDENIVFIGHPGSAGMGLDLSASPTIINYSNSFNGEDRIQFVERIHGPAMNLNLGATIIDLICLPTDKVVLDNLNKKIDLQSMTMGQLKNSLTQDRGD